MSAAAARGARVTLIERHEMGGDCLNTGCVPSKALIRSAKFLHGLTRAPDFGVRALPPADFAFTDIMERVRRIIAAVEPHDSIEHCESLGIEVIRGDARLTNPWQVEVSHGSRT